MKQLIPNPGLYWVLQTGHPLLLAPLHGRLAHAGTGHGRTQNALCLLRERTTPQSDHPQRGPINIRHQQAHRSFPVQCRRHRELRLTVTVVGKIGQLRKRNKVFPPPLIDGQNAAHVGCHHRSHFSHFTHFRHTVANGVEPTYRCSKGWDWESMLNRSLANPNTNNRDPTERRLTMVSTSTGPPVENRTRRGVRSSNTSISASAHMWV